MFLSLSYFNSNSFQNSNGFFFSILKFIFLFSIMHAGKFVGMGDTNTKVFDTPILDLRPSSIE